MRSYSVPDHIKRNDGLSLFNVAVRLEVEVSVVGSGKRDARMEAVNLLDRELGLKLVGFDKLLVVKSVAEVWDTRHLQRADMDERGGHGLTPREYVHYARLDQAKIDRRKQREVK